MIRTKISGITDLFTAKTAEKAGVDFISFVFDMDNKYYIPPVNAEIISKQMPDMRKVGIFTDEDLDVVNSVADMVGLDYVQLNNDRHPYALEMTEVPEEISNMKILNYIMMSKMPAVLRAS